MRKWLVLFCIVFLNIFQASSQQVTVSIKATNTSNEPLPFATIQLLSVPDTLNVQKKLSDSSGVALFEVNLNQPYLVRISSLSYQQIEKSITVREDDLNFTFAAEPITKSLSNVVITATRPLMRQEDDKTIVDPEVLALSSTNSFEILEKTPGLFIDQDGNIYLSSTTPARVYINGREQRMSAADMATILKSLPPNAISSIEIMRTPSARYDASGGGGIVNVILRKGVRIGLTGSVNTGFNQGEYGNRFFGFNLNNSSGKLTNYLNLQVSRRNNYEQLQTERLFRIDSLLNQNARTIYPTNSYFIGYGIGYQFSPKWELNYDGRLSYTSSRNSSTNLSEITKIGSSQPAYRNEALVQNIGNNYNLNQGINAKYKLDSIGSEWTTDISFSFSPINTEQDFSTQFTVPSSYTLLGEGTITNRLKFFTAQTNFLKKLPNRVTVEAGLKSTNVSFNNNNEFYRTTVSRELDNVRTGAYDYNENINAAYVQGSKTFGSIILKAGSRVENTNMKGHQIIPKDTSFSIHRTDFFPYIYLSRSLLKIAGFDLKAYLVYRRTINRPAYEYLNPSQRFIDPYLFEAGNPSLRPQFTNNYEANISVDERPIFVIGVNEAKDIFTQVIYQADTARSQAFRTYDNLGSNKETYFRAIGAIPPGKKYFIVVGTQYNHNHYQGIYEGKPLEFKRGSWSLFSFQSLKVTPNTQFTLQGFVRFNGQMQFYELSSFGALNLSLNQQFLNKKLTLSLNAQDVFFTNKNNFSINQGSVVATGMRQNDTRRFGMNVRYNFGIRKKEENKIPDLEAAERTKP